MDALTRKKYLLLLKLVNHGDFSSFDICGSYNVWRSTRCRCRYDRLNICKFIFFRVPNVGQWNIAISQDFLLNTDDRTENVPLKSKLTTFINLCLSMFGRLGENLSFR